MTYPAPNPPYIAARYHGGSQTPRLIVMHSTVGPTKAGSAKAVAQYFANIDHAASAHYVVDEAAVYQCVKDHVVAYHCGYNQDSLGVEMCDNPSQPRTRWWNPEHRRLRRRTARLVAELCLAYDIRPRFVGVKKLVAGELGITTHAAMSEAFKRSTHWDPGAWPRRRFIRQVGRQIRRIKAGN